MGCEHNNNSSSNSSSSSNKSRNILVETAFHACIGKYDASLCIGNETSVILKANGKSIELLLPASICTLGDIHSNENDVFIAIGSELPADDPLRWVLIDVNEKLAQIPPVPSSLGSVFQCLLIALHTPSSSDVDFDNLGIKAIGEDEYGDEEDLDRSLYCIDEHVDNLGDHTTLRTFLYKSAYMAKKQSDKNDCNDSRQMETLERLLEAEKGITEKLLKEWQITMLSSNEETSYSTSLQAILNELINVKKGIQVETNKRKNNEKDSVHNFGRNNNDEVPILGGVRISLPNEREMWKWHVKLDPILFKSYQPLYDDMVNYARDKEGSKVGIELEFIFPLDYPFSPPFVRVVSPRFLIWTGHIAEAGAVCIEFLSESGWNPAHSFESMLVQIVNAIIDQKGRLDTTTAESDSPGIEYTEMNAREVFKKSASDYGWVETLKP